MRPPQAANPAPVQGRHRSIAGVVRSVVSSCAGLDHKMVLSYVKDAPAMLLQCWRSTRHRAVRWAIDTKPTSVSV